MLSSFDVRNVPSASNASSSKKHQIVEPEARNSALLARSCSFVVKIVRWPVGSNSATIWLAAAFRSSQAARSTNPSIDQEAVAVVLLDLTVVQHRCHVQIVGAALRHAYPLGMELTVLGHTVRHPIEHVEVFPAPANVTVVRFTTDEVASMCPVTQQPDLSRVVIEYGPAQSCVESKSLKLYLWGFRDREVFAEALAAEIATEVMNTAQPHWVTVTLTQRPRGGIEVQAVAHLDA